MVAMTLFQPSPTQIQRVVDDNITADFNHAAVGRTRGANPDSFVLPKGPLWSLDHARVQIGTGKDTFKKAKRLLQQWRQFQLGWASVDPQTPATPGTPLTVTAKTIFLWVANPLRVVYSEDVQMPGPHKRSRTGLRFAQPWSWFSRGPERPLRWQMATGTLTSHMLEGEESFSLEWRPEDDSVWFEILTFSRPVHPLPLVTFPITRFFQWRFRQEAVSALLAGLGGKPAPALGDRLLLGQGLGGLGSQPLTA